ncbi:MAG: DNA repair protein RecN [Gammaproteobacteria bacterium]
MLIRLAVQDLAVIREAELEFATGFTVLTGETGAGKSLLVDALSLVIGDRGAAALVRTGAERATVTAEFALPDSGAVTAVLAAREIPAEDPLILHRQMGADGRSRAWINGVPVPLTALRELAEGLIEIHGQHEHLALARPVYQRELLDTWAGATETAADVARAAAAVHEAENDLEAARRNLVDRDARLDFLRFQQRELGELNPTESEYQELLAEYERQRHGERIMEALQTALAALDEGEAPALAMLAAARQTLSRLPPGAGLAEPGELLAQAEALADEAVRRLRREAEAESDPQRIEWLNERISRYQALARKHACAPDELGARLGSITAEIAELDEGNDRLAQLERGLAKTTGNYREAAAELSRKRSAAAPRLAKAVAAAVHELGMPKALFEIALEPEDDRSCPPGGRERVRFDVATNEGLAPGPISQVASGGELSRLALALEVLASGAAGAPVMVFDEVDAGISGRVAELVGLRLKALAARRQVLCVTHLPQVAALADHHHAMRKSSRDGAALTKVEALDAERRVEAIAEMLAGVRVTDTARNHARELIARAAGG